MIRPLHSLPLPPLRRHARYLVAVLPLLALLASCASRPRCAHETYTKDFAASWDTMGDDHDARMVLVQELRCPHGTLKVAGFRATRIAILSPTADTDGDTYVYDVGHGLRRLLIVRWSHAGPQVAYVSYEHDFPMLSDVLSGPAIKFQPADPNEVMVDVEVCDTVALHHGRFLVPYRRLDLAELN